MVILLEMNNLDPSIDLLAELDNISKIHTLDRDTIDDVMLIMAKQIIAALRIERMSVWLLNKEKNALISMGEYDHRTRTFQKNSVLKKSDFLEYFDAIEENKVLSAENVRTHSLTKCLNEIYSIPNDVITLLDIPLRLEGQLIGVMCYEKTGDTPKSFSPEEVTFAFSVSLIFVSNLEARYRRAAQYSLEKALKEKDLLIKELNHRVKNNFAILISLLRISLDQEPTESARVLLDEFQRRIFSMMKIHDLLVDSGHLHQINISDYLLELFKEYVNSQPELSNKMHSSIQDVKCFKSSKEGLYIGLIITEIFINAVKHVADRKPDFQLELKSFKHGDSFVIEITDNGPGFDFDREASKTTLGLPLIKDLLTELECEVQLPKRGHTLYRFTLPF